MPTKRPRRALPPLEGVVLVPKPGGQPGETIRWDELPAHSPIKQAYRDRGWDLFSPIFSGLLEEAGLGREDFTSEEFDQFCHAALRWACTHSPDQPSEQSEGELTAVLERVAARKVERLAEACRRLDGVVG